MFLRAGIPVRVRLGLAVGRRWGQRSNFPHGAVGQVRLTTVSPLTLGQRYSGDAAIPERERQEDARVPPRSQDRFVVDLSAWVVRG
jgi:hypothetical protein